MRCHAYALAAELYYQREAQLVAGLRVFDRDYFSTLVSESEHQVELLSGEWRRMFEQATAYRRFVDVKQRRSRLLVPPEDLISFGEMLAEQLTAPQWSPLVIGLAELAHVMMELEPGSHGLVFLEEDETWSQSQGVSEIIAMRPAVYECLEEEMQRLFAAEEHAILARLCGDHGDAEVEFPSSAWQTLRQLAANRAPELLGVIEGAFVSPADYTIVRELLAAVIGDGGVLPSLEAWLRVHGDTASYGLYFRDLGREGDPF